MRTNIYSGLGRILLALLFCCNGLFAQNDALHFDGDDDFITLNPINNLNPLGDFRAEMWFISEATGGNGTCFGDFRRLFSFGASGPNRFEVGECMGTLSINLSGTGIRQSTINVRDGQWHCISAVRTGGVIDIIYDGAPAPNLTGLNGAGLAAVFFRLGHWPGGTLTPGQDWLGQIDEVKIWSNTGNFTACSACVQTCQAQGLVAYWRFDEGIPNGNNTNLTSVSDCTGNGNDGDFYLPIIPIPTQFALNGTTSNFVPSAAPMLYPHYSGSSVFISDPLQTVGLGSICSGDPVHFSIFDAIGNLAQAATGTTVQWQYSDDCFATGPIPITPTGGSSAVFSGFSFVSPPSHPATTLTLAECAPKAFVDRCFRALITVTNGLTSCAYFTDPLSLRICCPIQNAQVNVTPMGPLCEGDMVQFTASVSSNMPPPNANNNVHISWCVIINGGTPIPLGPLYDDQVTINYPVSLLTVTPGTICFQAKISNCACPPVTVQKCVTIDPKPVCGTITGKSANLMPDPDLNPDHYLICPGLDAAVGIATPFLNCIPIWQFSYPNTQPGIWHDMGTSNGCQNTGTLPWSGPSVNPYEWPAGETCILYRIKCVPPNTPSGCPPCYSNELRVCKKTPHATPVVTAAPNPICKGGSSTLSVQAPVTGVNYDWYCNGLYVGSGSTFTATQAACYWVVCYDGCFAVASNKVCLTVCEPVAVICCPVPICPCVGDPITLSGQEGPCSFGNCGPLTYFWSWTDVNGPHTATTATITSTPFATGTTYTLTVTDQNGCTDTTQATVVPCPN
ncbi:MAG: LamG-like jellyroll fold domain-containing protein [Saprospiraceae bacterium]